MAWIFVLVAVVFIHELGHFLVARWCGVNVSTFSIGFGREILGFTDSKGTRWKLGWIPLGGYVKFMDDENGASMPSRDKLSKMSDAERNGSFHAKPLWQRAAVVAAGPMANFLSAILMFAGTVYFLGTQTVPAIVKVKPLNPAVTSGLQTGDVVTRIDSKPVSDFKQLNMLIEAAPGRQMTVDAIRNGAPVSFKLTPETQIVPTKSGGTETRGLVFVEPLTDAAAPATGVAIKVNPNYAAVSAGLKTGDLVTRVDDQSIPDFQEFSRLIAKSAGRELTLNVQRDGAPVVIKVTPQTLTVPDNFGGTETRGIIGVEAGADRSKLPIVYLSPVGALQSGIDQTWQVITTTLGYFADVSRGQQSADKIGGIATVIDVSNKIATFGFAPLVQLIALLSVSIGLLNLFPIPLLDGGHLMYYAFEAISGKPLSETSQEVGFRIGFTLVSMLMVLALWNDRGRIANWIHNLIGLFS